MRKIKKLLCIVWMLPCCILAQDLIDTFEYLEQGSNKRIDMGIYTVPNETNTYHLRIIGADANGSYGGIVIVDIDEFASTNITNVTKIHSTAHQSEIERIEFSVTDLSDISQAMVSLSSQMCYVLAPCVIQGASVWIRLTWSNESTGPVDEPAPTVPSTYTWNTTDKAALLTALGYPNGKVYQTDYKSSDRIDPNVNDAEVVLTNDTTQTVFIGDPSVSNKRTPMVLTIDTNASIVIQAKHGVGINTENPQVELDVNGIIKSTIRDQNGIERECNGTTKGSIGYDANEDKFKGCYDDGWHEIQRVP